MAYEDCLSTKLPTGRLVRATQLIEPRLERPPATAERALFSLWVILRACRANGPAFVQRVRINCEWLTLGNALGDVVE